MGSGPVRARAVLQTALYGVILGSDRMLRSTVDRRSSDSDAAGAARPRRFRHVPSRLRGLAPPRAAASREAPCAAF